MSGGQVISLGELSLLLAFLLIPALLVALAAQFCYLRSNGLVGSRVVVSLLVTALISVLSTAAILLLAGGLTSRVLGVRDFALGPIALPVLPLAFIVVALVAPPVSIWTRRRV